MSASIQLSGVSHRFGNAWALNGVDLDSRHDEERFEIRRRLGYMSRGLGFPRRRG